jgi:hypothetical protein
MISNFNLQTATNMMDNKDNISNMLKNDKINLSSTDL